MQENKLNTAVVNSAAVTWNPVFNFVMDIKRKYTAKFGGVEYRKYGENTCFEYWIEQLQDQDAIAKVKLLEINQRDEFILLRYGNYAKVCKETDMELADIWNLYDGFYLECRSLVIDLKRECMVLTPFAKFRNLNECPENSIEAITAKIENAKVVEITNKLDGSMQSARWYNGKLFMAGSQAIDSAASWRLSDGYCRMNAKENYIAMLKENPEYTFIFEYIALKDAHVVKYTKEQEGLYLIGIRNVATGKQLYYKEVLVFAAKYNVLTTEIFQKTFAEILEEIKVVKSDKQEGFVVNIDGYLLKVKMDDYVHIHKVLAKLSSVNLVVRSIADDTFDDLISKIPAVYQPRVLAVAKVVFDYIRDTDERVSSYYNIAPKENRKDFMIWIDQNVPKKFRNYVRNRYLNVKNNYIKSGNESQPRYLLLKDMGVEDYTAIFEVENE